MSTTTERQALVRLTDAVQRLVGAIAASARAPAQHASLMDESCRIITTSTNYTDTVEALAEAQALLAALARP